MNSVEQQLREYGNQIAEIRNMLERFIAESKTTTQTTEAPRSQMTRIQRQNYEFENSFDQREQSKIMRAYKQELKRLSNDHFDFSTTFKKGKNQKQTTDFIQVVCNSLVDAGVLTSTETNKKRIATKRLDRMLARWFMRNKTRSNPETRTKDNERNKNNSRKNRLRDRRVAVYVEKEPELVSKNRKYGGLKEIISRKEIHSDFEDDEEAQDGVRRKTPSYRTEEFNKLIDYLELEAQKRLKPIRSGRETLTILEEKVVIQKEVPTDSFGNNILMDWMFVGTSHSKFENSNNIEDTMLSIKEEQEEKL